MFKKHESKSYSVNQVRLELELEEKKVYGICLSKKLIEFQMTKNMELLTKMMGRPSKSPLAKIWELPKTPPK